MDTRRDSRDMDKADRAAVLALIEAALVDSPTDDFLWDLYADAA